MDKKTDILTVNAAGELAGESNPGTPITRTLLLAEGFIDHVATLTEQQVEDADDPFYFSKGEFRLYDVVDDFYYMGTRIDSMERLRELYQAETGRIYTRHEVLEDTPAPDYHGPVIGPGMLKKGIIKARLKGGPGDGVTVSWPAVASFYIYQEKLPSGRTAGHRYQRPKNRKTIFKYIGPTE